MKIDINRLSDKQKNNLQEALKAYAEKEMVSSSSPPILYIELTQNCNARCAFCRGSKWKNKPQYDLSQPLFDILLKEYIPYASMVDLRGWGESLILPNFDEYIAKVAQFGPAIRLTTNLGCGNEKALQSILDHDVFISVSIDAADKETYERIRKGVSFDVVMKNIKFLTEGFLKKHGSLEGRFRLGLAPLQVQNLDQLERIIELAARFHIPEVRTIPLSAPPWEKQLLSYDKKKTIAVFERAVTLSKKTGVNLQLGAAPFEELKIDSRVFDLCCHPWLYALVQYDGKVGFCDHMIGALQGKELLGHLSQNKDEVWNGKQAQEIREAHRDKDFWGLPKDCQKCYKKGRYSDHEQDIDIQFSKWLVTENEIREKLEDRGCGPERN